MESDEYDNGTLLEVAVLQSVSAVLQLISLGFNGAIIYTIWRKSLMKIPSSRFVFSLCLSHLLVSIISLAVSGISYFIPSQSFLQNAPLMEEGNDNENGYTCVEIGPAIMNHTLLYITFGVSISTLLTVTLISAERYITIARPMKYKSIVTPRRCFTAISLCWVLSAIFVIFPVVFFHKKTKQCGAFLIPIGSVGLYFAVIITLLTILALSVMIICYSHIFTIAKSKCQKVQIGQFSSVSAPASISSEWPSSVYSSVQGHQGQSQNNRGWFHTGSRMTSSNSLLHWVLMANLRQHSNPLRSAKGPKSPDVSPTSSIKSEPDYVLRSPGSSTSKDSRGLSRAKRKWRKYLQQNYNSPRKTVCTILCLIGSVILTQVPMSFILFTHLESNPVLFYFCHDLLFAISSLTNPILYGFLNRNIRDQLWRVFRPKTQRRNRQRRANSLSNNNNCAGLRGEMQDIFSPKREKGVGVSISRKGSLTSEESNSTTGCAIVSRMPSTSSSGYGGGENSLNPVASIRRKDTAIIGLDELDRFKLRRKPTLGLGLGGSGRKFLDFSGALGPTSGGGCGENSGKRRGSEMIPEEEVQVLRDDIGDLPRNDNEVLGGPNDPGVVLDEEVLQQLEFPRKPSQDSGADMSFSDEEREDPEEDLHPVNVENYRNLILPNDSDFNRLSPYNNNSLYSQPFCRSCQLLNSRNASGTNRSEITASYLGVPHLSVSSQDLDEMKSKSKSDSDMISSRGVKASLPYYYQQPPSLFIQEINSENMNEEMIIIMDSQCHLLPTGSTACRQEIATIATTSSTPSNSSQLPLTLNSVSSSRRQSSGGLMLLPQVQQPHKQRRSCSDLNKLDMTEDDISNGGGRSFFSTNSTPSCSNCNNQNDNDLLDFSCFEPERMRSESPRDVKTTSSTEDISIYDICDHDCDNDNSTGIIIINKDLIRVSGAGPSRKPALPHNDSFCSVSTTDSSGGSSGSTTGSDDEDYIEDDDNEDENAREGIKDLC